jgi:transcriptional regulator with XRE-family HTH domain
MVLKIINQLFGLESSSTPNNFTNAMGKLIRKARKEAGLSQVELAKKAYFRQASISDIENGKREVSASELVYFSLVLNKPIMYFFPDQYKGKIIEGELSSGEQELLSIAHQIDMDDLQRLIAQAKALLQLSLDK